MSSHINQELKDLKTQQEGLVYYIRHLDIEMIDSLLDNDKTYQDFPKYLFVQKFGHALDRFIKAGDTHLNVYTGTCNSDLCSKGCGGNRFIGNTSGLYMDLIIKVKQGTVLDVYECHQFSTISPKKTLAQKVWIDTTDLLI
ncbi:hypothetical protein [Sediminibacterium sp. C3]|uniref:hypothetical protein n=1 Tax=Sediminibacterium sp. C3 TaxID=1267211 RepID=UPI00047B95D6|nr:hypothetical protein [Sediminibacterium sp. C3]